MVFLKLKINYLQKSSTGVFDQCKFTVSDNYRGKLLGAFLYILCAILFDPSMLESVRAAKIKPSSEGWTDNKITKDPVLLDCSPTLGARR